MRAREACRAGKHIPSTDVIESGTFNRFCVYHSAPRSEPNESQTADGDAGQAGFQRPNELPERHGRAGSKVGRLALLATSHRNPAHDAHRHAKRDCCAGSSQSLIEKWSGLTAGLRTINKLSRRFHQAGALPFNCTARDGRLTPPQSLSRRDEPRQRVAVRVKYDRIIAIDPLHSHEVLGDVPEVGLEILVEPAHGVHVL